MSRFDLQSWTRTLKLGWFLFRHVQGRLAQGGRGHTPLLVYSVFLLGLGMEKPESETGFTEGILTLSTFLFNEQSLPKLLKFPVRLIDGRACVRLNHTVSDFPSSDGSGI